MASYFLAPRINTKFFIPGTATPANGAQLFFYVANSVATKQTAYKDNAGLAQWANPLVLDSGGDIPNGGEIWFLSGQNYKAVLAPSNDIDPPGSPYDTWDNLSGINDNAASVSDWVAGPSPTFVSGTQFTLVGDQTTNFVKSRRIKASVTAGTVFGSISSVSFGGGLTTVNVAFASGALDSGLTGNTISYSLIAADNPSINADYSSKLASSVASAGSGTTNIWGIAGNYVHVTGTNTIASFSSAPYAGVERDIIFDSALTLVHGGNLLVPGAVNVSTAANDRAKVRADTTSSAVITFYTKASGKPVVNTANTQPTRTVFTSSSGTYTTPVTATRINVRCVGGGGGGCGNAAATAATGTSTTFGTLTASGGGGGANPNGGAGGSAAGGDINLAGSPGGGAGVNAVASVFVPGGDGGGTPFGTAGGGAGNVSAATPSPNTGSGGGGGGGASGTNAGGGGGGGGYVEKLFAPPSTSYSYVVGPGGAFTTGTASSGGVGASGLIIIDEYYD